MKTVLFIQSCRCCKYNKYERVCDKDSSRLEKWAMMLVSKDCFRFTSGTVNVSHQQYMALAFK